VLVSRASAILIRALVEGFFLLFSISDKNGTEREHLADNSDCVK